MMSLTVAISVCAPWCLMDGALWSVPCDAFDGCDVRVIALVPYGLRLGWISIVVDSPRGQHKLK